ncbi:B3 domain-containing protein Os12g0592300 [Dendrobium catenatum]|uniref:B3 domain-containing protein Os12g0592300 n=1 Tax=Dendrobium catenatum TaxID=906689 RepID=UPI0009F5A94E|nr:B3 domain-containing protein Os12g0592300 [Dendrobium catenatum]XP_020673978.1 B3 domain-containing protein Os12g0592300 [Dendrobium catenatum]XP_028550654.1 B3 domain-containing protein Os12g0592300 [Dendrobium catenatum]XP_028550699.1 B3 domain-containing protein Os12g0592300 [Dendrobium catenatum]XP_028550715.1 B3 domain-containing protein Os12g0592300 [Dendrobium catenatum]XP_028550740.1 B3 domain-containing protein Os12g0592300 [Dendrobium catenatum]XP_028550767.1 B3 domain-containing
MEIRGCWNCKKFEEHYYWNHLEETSLCFMKLMEGDFSLVMEFPNKFAWKFRVDLPDLITLKVSNGDLWKICLFKEENHFYLKDGWKEFIVANGIKEHYSLFFKYAGNSTFTVKIFDQTGCFRDTTNFTRYNKNKAYKVYQRRHRMDVAAPNLKRSRSSTFKIYHSSSLAYYDYKPEQEIPNNNSSDGSFSDEVSYCKRKHRERSDQDVKPSQICQGFDKKHISLYGRLKSKTKEGRENSEDAVKKLKPFYVNETADSSFAKVLMKSHLCGQSFMAIPARFVSDHFHAKPKKIILCKQKQKQWIVSCKCINNSFGFGGKSWLHFVQDNELKEGDVLFCKLVNSSKGVMDVRIV